jgi:aspartyl-tRNA synthetase
MPRSEIDAYTQFVAIYGAKGLAYIKVNEKAKGRDGLQSPIVKNLHDAARHLERPAPRRRPDLLRRRQGQGGQRRHRRAAREDRPQRIRQEERPVRRRLAPLWVVDFPMFEYDEDGQRWAPAPPVHRAKDGHEDFISTNPGAIAKAYDMVLNGWELGGGSVRIHRADVQSKVFRALKIDAEEARLKFGFLLDALQYGAPRTAASPSAWTAWSP